MGSDWKIYENSDWKCNVLKIQFPVENPKTDPFFVPHIFLKFPLSFDIYLIFMLNKIF